MTDDVWLADATARRLPSEENESAETPLAPDSNSEVSNVGILQDCPGSRDQVTKAGLSS